MKSLDEYIAYWRKQSAEPVQVDMELRDHAMSEARRLAGVLTEVYGAKRVYLFGSLARARARFADTSDIDLAVEGLSADHFYEALGDLLCRSTFIVDLKPLEEVSETLRLRIAREGVLLYG